MAKYINPATDFGFKRIFKDEEITREFLNALLQKDDSETHIKSVTITDGEFDESNKDARRVIYDVHCTTDTGEQFVIEMQNDSQIFFSERIVFYLSRAASTQQGKGCLKYIDENGVEQKKDWNYHLKKIYGVFFMNFKDDNKENEYGLSHFAFMETSHKFVDTRVFQYWKIQMPIYRDMKASDCNDVIDKWLFNLSNMDTMETALAFKDEIPVFKRLEKMATYSALTPQQQMQYNDSFNNYLAYMGQQEYKLREGIKIGHAEGHAEGLSEGLAKGRAEGLSEGLAKGRTEGRAEGRAEGLAEQAIAIARRLKAKGTLSLDEIAEMTGLTPDEINTL